MADKDAERIKFETELLKLATLVAVAAGGGSVSLLLGDPTLLRLGLAGVGFFITLVLAVTVWRFERRIRKLIAQIGEAP
jgi:hypothetical protein